MLVRSNFFPEFAEKIEKLQLSWSKQHNKMLKIRSETLKIRKNGTTIKLEKNSRDNFPNPEDLWDPKNFQKISRIPRC